MDDIYGEYKVDAMSGGIEELMALSPAMESFLATSGIQSSFSEDRSQVTITFPAFSLSATFDVNVPVRFVLKRCLLFAGNFYLLC